MQFVYDAIIVGARAAGAATALLLARRGMRVLVVERAQYGSDTLSTHALMAPAVLQLARWNLLDTVIASGAPPVRRAIFHYPGENIPVDIKGGPLFAPRRTVLDRILADAAIAAGAEIRFGVTVDALQKDAHDRVVGIVARDEQDDAVLERANIVIGADGIRSVVAQHARAPITREAASTGACIYGYFRGLDAEDFEWAYGDRVSAGLVPTNDDEVCVFVAGSTERFRRDAHGDLERGFQHMLRDASLLLAARVRDAKRNTRLRGFAGVRGHYRKPHGPGWALVGDAGYFRDPITTHGISDAFRDAELLARAIDGQFSFDDYESMRDAVTRDLFDVTEKISAYAWTQEELRVHLRDFHRAMKAETELLQSLRDVTYASAALR